jgi:hypothetical protein
MAPKYKPTGFSLEDYQDLGNNPETLERFFGQLNRNQSDVAAAVEFEDREYKTVTLTVPTPAATPVGVWAPWSSFTSGFVNYPGFNPCSTMVEYVNGLEKINMRGLLQRAAGGWAINSVIGNIGAAIGPTVPVILWHFINRAEGPGVHRVDPLANGDIVTRVAGSGWGDFSFEGISFFTGRTQAAATYSAPTVWNGNGWPLTLTTKFPKPGMVLVASAKDVTPGTTPAMGVEAEWVDWLLTTDGKVSVRRIDGLTPGRRYEVTFCIFR